MFRFRNQITKVFTLGMSDEFRDNSRLYFKVFLIRIRFRFAIDGFQSRAKRLIFPNFRCDKRLTTFSSTVHRLQRYMFVQNRGNSSRETGQKFRKISKRESIEVRGTNIIRKTS